jgi:hypothetical protein
MAASKTANVSKFGWPARLSLAIVVASALSAVAHAQTPQSAAEKAAAVFDRHCASCHQSGRTSGRTPDSFANILRLDEVASEENLVLPRRPDASRIYQRMVGAHPPLDTSLRASGTKGPSPEEIEAVRDWIDGIPPRDEACRARTFVTPASILEATQAWLGRLAPADAADTRFISLIHLHNACASEAQIGAYRDAIGKLVNRLSRRAEFVAVHTLGDSNALLAVKLADMAWQPAEWDRLVGGATSEAQGAVRADWLATRALAEAGPDRSIEIAIPELAALAREWQIDVGLYRAAAESGLEPEPFAERLRSYRGEDEDIARRLQLGLVKRDEWERLRVRLISGSAPLASESGTGPPNGEPSTIDLALWTDNSTYSAGDLVIFLVKASQGCHLTLISVNRDGKAIVLFPNDFENENAIAPGVIVRVPGTGAGYQLRFDRPGPETVVGICQRAAARPEGITFNYEKQRFAVLGNWRAFLRNATRREDEEQRSGESRSRKKPKAEQQPIGADGPALEGRTAITITVGEAAKP